jgi:hypothetical protein
MADDDLDEDFDPDAIDEEIDDTSIDDDVIEDVLDDDDALASTDVLEETEKVGEDDPVAVPEEPAARTKKRADEEDDDEEELDPDDVEADLDTILKDRIAAADEDDDDEELDEPARPTPDAPNGVVPKRANEFMCTGCFLLVNRGQFGPEGHLQCPVGESECPAIDELQSTAPAKPARSGRKR